MDRKASKPRDLAFPDGESLIAILNSFTLLAVIGGVFSFPALAFSSQEARKLNS